MCRWKRFLIGMAVVLICLLVIAPQMANAQHAYFEYLGSTLPDDNLHGFSIAGDYAYVTGGHAGMFVVDISNPNNPLALGSFDTPGFAWDVCVSGNYAYLADGFNGLQIFDISNPGNPDLIGSYDTPGISEALSVNGNYAFMADGGGGLQVIDVSNAANPVLAFACDTLVNIMDIFILGNYAYLADRGLGLLIYNINIPNSPVFIGSFYDDDYCGFDHIFVAGNYAFLVPQCILAELMIVDISDPANSVLVSSDDVSSVSAYDIYVDNNYAFLNLTSGLLVYDVSDPYIPERTGDYQTAGSLYSTHAYGNLLYMSGDRGFWICNYTVLAGCDYVVGDANNSGDFNGLDIIYGINYFKSGTPPPYECECTPGNIWYVAGDVNGSCNYNGLDITYGVAYFKGGPEPIPCPDCPPN